MLDLLSPLRGYIAQNLQFYLGKYIEDIQLEGLGLFGGDLVLNDLEIKRHVLRESLEIPSSFDFTRGFIRELRIHIPWTQLLSQPIEVKLYTIELILTARSSTASANSVDAAVDRETEIDQPKSGWVHDTLHKILANVSLQINNLVLKYEHDDVVFSIALGTLDFYSASGENGWKRSFEELKGGRRDICKRIDAKDVTIFLDRYTNDEDARDNARQNPLRRRVVGYEVPVLSRTSASVRAKLELFYKAGQSAPRSKSTSPLHQPRSRSRVVNNIVDVDGLFTYKPSVLCDPFYYYLCNRSSVIPMHELDVFIGELPFSVSDRQLEMLSQLIQSASHRFDQALERVPSARNDDFLPDWVHKNESFAACSIPVEHPQKIQVNDQVGTLPYKHEPWFGWVMNALGTAENEEEDALMSELLAETRGALIQHQSPANKTDESLFASRDPVTATACVRVCVTLVSLTLRKHDIKVQVEYRDATKVESSEEFVPVANLGMVKVSIHPKRNIVARPAMPILYLTLSYVALELLIARGQEECGTDLVFEIEKAEIVSATNGTNGEDTKCKNEGVLLTWGSVDATHISDCVSHPYFISSFFEEELTRLNQRKTRSFDIVKVAPDAGIPVWTTLEKDRRRMDSRESQSSPCECYFAWNGKAVRCTSTSAISRICQKAIEIIGIKERILDDKIILDAVSTAWASSEFPLMITEEMTLALTAATEEYRAHRNPDLGSSDNLVQLLLPQLVALCCRHLGHSCSAASLLSPPGSVEIQHRSVHSALRMRSASTIKITEHDVSSPDHRTKEEGVNKVVDVSIGAAKAVVDPLKCPGLLESFLILLRENEKDDVKVPKRINVSTPATKNLAPETMEAPDIISITLNDVKLITVSNVHVHFPDQRSCLGRRSSYCGGLNLIGSDFVWLEKVHPVTSKNRLQVGALTAHLGEAQSDFTGAPLVEVLGPELMNTQVYADGGSNEVLFASLVKARVDLSLSALHNVATVVNDVASLLGYAIAWKPIKLASEQSHTSFQIEVCQSGLSRTVSHRPRAVMAQCQSLRGGIASVSVTWKRRKTGKYTVILQGGIAAMMRNDSKPRTSFFKFDTLYEKTSGKLVDVPIISSLGLLTLKPDLVSTKCTHCQLCVQAHLAYLDLDLQGVLHLIGLALSVMKEFAAALPGKAVSTPECEHFKKDALDGNQASCASTGWSFVIDMKAGGCDVRVNEALQLTLSQISLVTTEKEPFSPEFVIPGGVLYLEFVAKGATLFASDSGSLKGIQDPIVLSTEEFGALMNFSHENADFRHNYAFNVMLHTAKVQAPLSRLKLLYLIKIPYIEDEAFLRDVTTNNASHLHKLDKRECNKKSSTRCRWFWRLGAQLDLIDFTCTADIYHRFDCKKKRIRAAVNGKMHNITLAARISNYHPTQKHPDPTMQEKYTDIQLSVGNVEVVEVHACKNICTKLGDFSRLPDRAFMGILVCLDLSDLKVLSETLRAIDTSKIFDQESLPPAMVSWHLTNTITKTFQEIKAKWHQSKADRHHSLSKIPLVVAWNDPVLSKGSTSFPLLSGFYRNYSEVSLPHQVVAVSMDSVDFVMTMSSLLCLASLLNVRGKKKSKPVIETNIYGAACKTGVPKVSAYNSDGLTSRVSLANIELSLLFGKVRIIFPNENLMDYVQTNRQVVPENVVMVLEAMSMLSAVRNDISLDGLGYPPFNSRILPRRPTVQAQRFGQSQLQIGCRAGRFSAFVAELDFSPEVATLTNNFDVVGPFEEYIGSVVGHLAQFTNAEAFLSPLNVTCSIKEELLAKAEGSSSAAKITASIAMTNLRLQLNEQLFDVLYARYAGIYRGAYYFRQFFASTPPVQLTPRHTEESSELSTKSTSTNQLEITFSSDGIDINVIEIDISTHFRIGLIVFVHNTENLSGSASIQNIVVGHRIYKNDTETVAVEEVIFGAKAEPSLWQLAVENYPEKMVVARWKFGDRSEGTLFVDVQAYQLHISHHFIRALARFCCLESHTLNCSRWEGQHFECSVQTVDRKPFLLKNRWNVKLLVAPSVVSYWRQHSTNGRKSGVWMTSGQLFASMGIGSDEVAQQSLSAYGSAVSEINRYIAVPTLKLMLNLDKFGLNISDDLPPLIVLFQKNSVSPITIPTSSTWPRFVKYISILSDAQRFLQDCSIRVTGGQHQLLERVAIGDEILLLYTGIARTNMQAEVNALCMKLSSSSLGAIQTLLSTLGEKDSGVQTERLFDERNAKDDVTHKSFPSQEFLKSPTDDFKDLKRMAESRRPLPGELVFTEALFIETQTIVPDYTPPVVGSKINIRIDPNRFDLKLADVAAFLEDCNKPWNVEEPGPSVERSSNPDFTNRTHSYMGMRWCYHIPRKISKIVAEPVPIPPNGVPSAWPLWNWNQNQEGDVCRLCDILCQLRCWDSKISSYVVVGEFCVPWEQMASAVSSSDLDDVNEFGSFGELMNQWFDDNKEETLFRAKLLEFGARTRTYTFDNDLSSDNWELRWRAPLESEHDPENKQIRLLINALLASSLQVQSVLIFDAYQRVVSSITFPQVSLSVSHVGPENDSHDIITAEFRDTEVSCLVVGTTHTRTLNIQVLSGLQVYLNNMAQLLTASVIPRTTIDALVEISAKGMKVSTVIGPVSLYLTQTSMLVLSAIPRLLLADQKPPDENLSSMRIKITNYTGVDVWYRQDETLECLFLPAEASAAYSWLSLASSPYYQLCFALDDPRQEQSGMMEMEKNMSEQDSFWCDPCRINENCVTGRFFSGYGFVWICVELSGLQTNVLLRSSLTVSNYCDFPVRFKVNNGATNYRCVQSESLFECVSTIRKSVAYNHSHCLSLDGSACSFSTLLRSDESVARVMAESVTTISFAIDGGSWCNVELGPRIPSAFDHVKGSDNNFLEKGQYEFILLHYDSSDESTQYVWAKFARATCKTMLPTDFDPLQPQISGRYTWMEMSLWPAIIAQNFTEASVLLSFTQKSTLDKLNLPPSSEKCLSTINPFEPFKIAFKYDQVLSSADTYCARPEFELQCTISEKLEEQVFVFEDCRVVVNFCDGREPMIRIRSECVLSIANMTPKDLTIKFTHSFEDRNGIFEKVESCDERSIGFAAVSDRLIIAVATIADPSSKSDQVSWSPGVSLDVKGETKLTVVPAAEAGLESLASAFCIELVNSEGYLKLTIRPQVVVINATSCNLSCMPTDGRGNALSEIDTLTLVSGDNAGWSAPVCVHKEAKKRSMTADVTSWLSSKLSKRSNEIELNARKQALMARLSCSFKIRLTEDEYEWTKEVVVQLLKQPLKLTSDGRLEHVDPPKSSTASANTQEELYPPPSTTTYRRRLLIRHRSFKHKMLTYTMTQIGKSICVMFFVDHQPPVIIHNEWQHMLSFCNADFPSIPEGIGAKFRMEYDWDLQISAKNRGLNLKQTITDDKGLDEESKLLSEWLEISSQSFANADLLDTRTNEHTRFQIGLPQYGWSNVLWQIGGIQFASFYNDDKSVTAKLRPTFLVTSFYRAGSWLISIICVEDPTSDSLAKSSPMLALPSATSPVNTRQIALPFLKMSVLAEELSLHFCDEHDPIRDVRELILYPEIVRVTCNTVSIAFATALDPPEISRYNARLGYLSHIRSYTSLFVSFKLIEVGHFLQACNFPVIFWFSGMYARKPLLKIDRVNKHKNLESLMNNVLNKQLPGPENPCLIIRVIYADTKDPDNIPPYFHCVELKVSPAVLQVEDDILVYVNAFVQPVCAALEGEAICRALHDIKSRRIATKIDSWSSLVYKSAMITMQRKVYVEYLGISDLQLTITARVSIPVLNSFDGTPLHFGRTEMREVFSFPDQLYKDLAADFVADTIVRSPMLLMSLNIFGNPAGFLRSFSSGVRDLIEIPVAASRNGYSPWVLTKGVFRGVASFLSHTTAGTLTSVSGFSYSISRTLDQLTLPADQLRKRHYKRPTHLSSAIADGLGSLGSSVVGAATGVVTTPIAVYKERQTQGLESGFRNVVGSVGMGLVGIVARPIGGVASLVSLASDGLLRGIEESRIPFDDSTSRFNARPNELLRYKLKVLSDAIRSHLVFAHGLWINPQENTLLTSLQDVNYSLKEQLKSSENESLYSLLLPRDAARQLLQATVVCSNECVYVVGVTASQTQAVLARVLLKSIEAVEENLKEPTVFDLGIKTSASAEWLRFRLPPLQRRRISNQLRLWLNEDSNLLF